MQSPDFQRLRGISFLGILDYCFEGKSYSTRYDHSLAVANLCSEYSLRKNLSETEKTYTVLAGLLHDIGTVVFRIAWNRFSKRSLRLLIVISQGDNNRFALSGKNMG